MKLLSRRDSAAGPSLPALPADALAAVAAALSPADRAALAATHPACAAALRATRTRCAAHVVEEAQLEELCATVSAHPAVEQLSLRWLAAAPPHLQRLVLPDTVHRLSLAFVTRQPSGTAAGAPLARGVTALCLSGFSDPGRRLNGSAASPWLGTLREMPALQALTLLRLRSDAGLENVTQLRSLHIAFPDHVAADTPADLRCPDCGSVHAEDVVQFLEGLKQRQDHAVVGPHIAHLPRLRALTLDFASDADPPGLAGYNALCNRFEWSHPLSRAPVFPALESLDVVNLPPLAAGPFQLQDVLPAAAADAPLLHSFFCEAGHNMRHPGIIRGLFGAAPALIDYRIEYCRRAPGGPLPPPRPILKQPDFECQFVYLEDGEVMCHYARRRRGAAAAAAEE